MRSRDVEVRAMDADDVTAVVGVFQRSLGGMRLAIGMSAQYESGRLDGGVGHLLGTDPGGSWVAASADGSIVGFAQAARRGTLWVLCHLFVDPASQSSGIGGRLLRTAFDYGRGCDSGLIASTPLAAAITLYARLPGFVVHPMMSASGLVDRESLPRAADVRVGHSGDRDLADAIDVRLRGGPHGVDIDYLVEQGGTLLVVPDRGYAVVSAEQVDLVAATDTSAAEQLLSEALRRTRPEAVVAIKRIGESQPWASRLAVRAGLRISPWGPLVSRNCAAPTAHYLADSAFC